MARALGERGVPATYSYAGRVDNPRTQPIPHRVGGFGGVDGLAAYLHQHNISHVIDATHPFAAQISQNAHRACRNVGVPLLALIRPEWRAIKGDNWRHVPDMAGAVAALEGPAMRVMLALGRLHMNEFAAQSQHHYVLRLVDTPKSPPKLAHHTVIVARGPFSTAGDTDLFRAHNIQMIVCKNAGGNGAKAKLDAARALDLPVVMIDRPTSPDIGPDRAQVATVDAVFHWLGTHQTP